MNIQELLKKQQAAKPDPATPVQPIHVSDALIDKAIMLAIYEVPVEQRCKVLRLDIDELEHIEQLPVYIERLAQRQGEELEQVDLINRGWDGLEESSLTALLTQLQMAPDPDFLLKVAAVANKAQRKQPMNKVIPGQSNAIQTVIYMNPTFVNKMQKNHFEIVRRNDVLLEKKDTNTMNPKRVIDLFKQNTVELDMYEAALVAN